MASLRDRIFVAALQAELTRSVRITSIQTLADGDEGGNLLSAVKDFTQRALESYCRQWDHDYVTTLMKPYTLTCTRCGRTKVETEKK